MPTPFFSTSISLEAAQSHIFDVIVVGAGPAGSSAAYHLAVKGVDVLLVDRVAFPRDKRCGDAVMPPALEELALMGLVDEMQRRFQVVERVGVWLGGMPGRFHPVGEDGAENRAYVAPRATFDAMLCEHALRHGAAWLDQVTIHAMQSEQAKQPAQETLPGQSSALLVGSREGRSVQLRARLVIAADGSGSRLAHALRVAFEQQAAGQPTSPDRQPLTAPQDNRARFTAMRGYYSGIDGLGDALEFYFRGEAGTFYYWIFPAGQGLANVGVIASMEQLRTGKPDLARALAAFLSAPELEGRAARARLDGVMGAAPIAAGLRGTALFGERVLCVGDAAALVDPRSAEGISGALWSGRVAAETAISALKSDDFTLTALGSYGDAVRARYQAVYDRVVG